MHAGHSNKKPQVLAGRSALAFWDKEAGGRRIKGYKAAAEELSFLAAAYYKGSG